ncbi:MAG TPA: phenylalanine--tRNA ligase subunit alpha [Candidatus Omnitrophota bacterium]|nr:phenylalanine--tRNA ligase subunit alpha [Candidatus Omnitrophota bacterium]
MIASHIAEIKAEAQQASGLVKSKAQAEAFRVQFLGKKSRLTGLFQLLKDVPAAEKSSAGGQINTLKVWLTETAERLSAEFGQDSDAPVFFDSTLPGIRPPMGSLHLLTQTVDEILSIFERMGFDVAEGPEVEDVFHNFTALNVPEDHPARDPNDTFYTEQGNLLRTQTSTVQIRYMQNHKPPFRMVAPGRVYRPDTVDASHSFMFHQMEGLLVDKQVSFAELKGVLHLFLRELFGKDVKMRFRPHFFPFTEPSVEVDIEWKNRGWLEILGAGLVDPNVFKAVGYDPQFVKGFAFGMGVERIAMIRHGIPDIRLFYENDIRFLRQFS